MRNRMMRSLVLALCTVAPVTAKAQELVPHARSQAVGFDIGAFIPSSNTGDQLDNAPPVSGFYEYYLTPRVSLRGSAGWTRPSVRGSSIDQVRMMPLRFDVNYNWERGKWHPSSERALARTSCSTGEETNRLGTRSPGSV